MTSELNQSNDIDIKIDEFTEYINQFAVSKGDKNYNITRVGAYPNSGSFNIPDGINSTKFFNLYIQLYNSLNLTKYKIPPKSTQIKYVMNFSQRQKELGPLMLDVDLDFDKSVIQIDENTDITMLEKHRYNEDDIIHIVEYINSLLHQFFEIGDDNIYAYLQEKPYTSIKYDKNNEFHCLKDGFHLCYIYPFTIQQRQFIYHKLIDYFSENNRLGHIGFTNTYDKIFDESTMFRNNWMIYGSYKSLSEKEQIYKCKYYYDFNVEKHKIDMEFDELVRLFDVRQYLEKVDEPVMFKDDFVEDIKKYMTQNEHNKQKSKFNDIVVNDQIEEFDITKYEDLKNIEMSIPDRRRLFVQGLLSLLKYNRVDDYNYWRNICWSIASINKFDDRLRNIFITFSKKSPKFNQSECIKLWERAGIDGKLISIGTLQHYAEEDNPDNYKKLKQYYYNSLQETIIQTSADVDIAQYTYNNYGFRHMFSGKVWYYFNDNLWIETANEKIYEEISHSVRADFSEKKKEDIQRFRKQITNIQEQMDNQELNNGNDKAEGVNMDSEYKRVSKLREERLKLYRILDKNLSTNSKLESIIKSCQRGSFYKTDIDSKMDSNPFLIGFENGVYDLQSRQFRRGKPEDYVSKSVGYPYTEYNGDEIVFKQINKYLSSLFVDEEVREYVLTYLASRLEGRAINNQFNIWTGKASNGKSVFTALLKKIYGTYYHTLEVSALTGKRIGSEQASPALAQTIGRRIIISQEPGANEQINAAFIKQLSGGQDAITVRNLYSQPVTFIPQFEVILVCNSIPNLDNDDQGTSRRVTVVDFKTTFVKNRKVDLNDPANKYIREADFSVEAHINNNDWTAPFMWLLINKYYPLYRVQGLKRPKEVSYATQRYINTSDECYEFLDENFIIEKELEKKFEEELSETIKDKDKLRNEIKKKMEEEMKKYTEKITTDNIFSIYNEWAKQNTYRKKYQTKAKFIEHIIQIKDLKIDKKNIIIGLYKKPNQMLKDENDFIDNLDDEENQENKEKVDKQEKEEKKENEEKEEKEENEENKEIKQ